MASFIIESENYYDGFGNLVGSTHRVHTRKPGRPKLPELPGPSGESLALDKECYLGMQRLIRRDGSQRPRANVSGNGCIFVVRQ